MRSAFDQAFADAAAPALLSQLGQEATYTPAGGDGVALTAIVGAEESREDMAADGRRVVRMREITVGTDPDADAGGVASVGLNDTITVDGVAYAVSEITSNTPSLISFTAIRTEDMQRSGDGYRRGRR